MKPIFLLLILYVVEVVLSPKKGNKYRNVDFIVVSGAVCLAQTVLDIILSVVDNNLDANMVFYISAIVQMLLIIGFKVYNIVKDMYTKYGIPKKYITGWRIRFISGFYSFDDKTMAMYVKGPTTYIGLAVLACAVVLATTFIAQSNLFVPGNTLMLPYSAGGLVSLLIEFGIFCLGESLLENLASQYKKRKDCKSRRDMAKVRYSHIDDYEYVFMNNLLWERNHILRATKFKWKKDIVKNSIMYYDFSSHSAKEHLVRESNIALESFIEKNDLTVNELYVAAYNLIERKENVLIKTPSYVDFEPYLTAMIKMKIAKTHTVVVVVSNEEKKLTTIDKLKKAFEEYFGFEGIPKISTIENSVDIERLKEEQRKTEDKPAKFSHLENLGVYGAVEVDESKNEPIKDADIVVMAPEDVCDPDYTGFIQKIIRRLGLIVYYDFSDCVQEEALFSRIVHSVLDYKDSVSTLYMSDGFFDLEQVLDNFFSKRNMYQIIVPREPSDLSYVMGWKAENINEMQSRTVVDASRNVGNHIPLLYDARNVRNDFMIIEDERDAYSENYSNFSNNELSSRLDCHVGWTNVLGGNSVFCSVSDAYNNVAHTYLATRGIGSKKEYINIVSQPYLLRGYLMYHLKHFTVCPGILSSYSPGSIRTAQAIAYEAAVKSHVAGCTSAQVLKYAQSVKFEVNESTERLLLRLVDLAYGEHLENVEISVDVYDRYYIDSETYKKIIKKSGFVEKIEFVNNNKVFLRNRREFSYLIPQQKIVLNGTKYTVESIRGNRVELTDSNTREAVFGTRPVRSCEVKVNDCRSYGNRIHNGNKSEITFNCLNCDVKIDVHGNIVFKDCYHPFSEGGRFEFIQVAEKMHREYKNVNVFSIKIGSPLINAQNRKDISKLMAAILNEMLPTFFPHHSERILIGCSDWGIDIDKEDPQISEYNILTQMDIEGSEALGLNEICLYILEDSPLETGLVNVFWQDEEFRYMMKIMEDYLFYQETVRRQERQDVFDIKYVELLHTIRKILLYVLNDTIDHQPEDRSVHYHNSIRRTRSKFNCFELDKNFVLTCDFCGKQIISNSAEKKSYYFYAYSGLVSCMDCHTHSVCSETHKQDRIDDFRDHINGWFEKKYKSSVTHGFYNYLEDAEFLADISRYWNRYYVSDEMDTELVNGLSYTPENLSYRGVEHWQNDDQIPVSERDEFEGACDVDIDVVRTAYKVYDEGYPYIFIRDGLAHDDYMATLCHEMTHQWQYTHINVKGTKVLAPGGVTDEFGMPVDMSMFRIEGHAEWERIRYMKNHGQPVKALKESARLKNTPNDPYGRGYRWMCRMMQVGSDDRSIPVQRGFGFWIKRNFYQLTNNSFGLMQLYFPLDSTESDSKADTDTTLDGSSDTDIDTDINTDINTDIDTDIDTELDIDINDVSSQE